jgi:hypothetical protein
MSQKRKKLFAKTTVAICLRYAIAIAMTIWTSFSLSYLIFGILGKTSEDKAWSYVLVLYVSLAIAAIGLSLQIINKLRGIGIYLSNTATGAILGFFSGGWVTNESPLWASVGAVILGLGSLAICYQPQDRFKPVQDIVLLALNTGSTVNVYGFALLVGTNAIALMTAGHWLAGICWSLLSIYSLWLTLRVASNLLAIK